MKPSDYDFELDELHKRSVGRLLGSETFDAVAFSQLYEYLCAKAEKIKDEHVVSKQVISVVFSAQRSIENAAPYNAQAREGLSLAGKFSLLLELVGIGEAPSDRKPGVPRVV